MYKEILESASLSKIFAFLLVAPARSFTVLEISKRLGLNKSKTVRGLNYLSEKNLVFSFVKKNKRYYLINLRHPNYQQAKNVFAREKISYQDDLFTAIKGLGKLRAAFLSGIFTGYPKLPVDILLVGKVNLAKLSKFFAKVEKLMGQEINYSIMNEEEFRIRRDTFDKFIKDIFDYRHLVVLDKLK